MRTPHLTPSKAIARAMLALWICIVPFAGCRSRSDHRRWADCEVAEIIQQRECDPSWDVPDRSVLPNSHSRMADQNCPDCGALPPDDPAAHSFMHCADCRQGWPCWHHRGDLPSIEFSDWKEHLQTDAEGALVLTRENVMEHALLHSRDYQLQFEQLYFSALALTLERFDFDHQWFGRSSTFADFNGNGPPPFGSRTLSLSNGFGFSKNLTTGGQLLANVANSFVWEFAGSDVSAASTGVLFSFVQPLLRGAFREVRMEPLTQAERNVLYELRDFARFRRAFYVDVIGSNGYLGLLAVSQAIKNQRANLEALERNLAEHEKLVGAGLVAPIQVDQIFQQYQQGRLDLLAAEQALESALDQFKLQLGLPPQFKVRLDSDALSPFELSSAELDKLGEENERLRLSLLQYDERPPVAVIEKGLDEVKSQQSELKRLHREIDAEWKEWQGRVDDREEPTEENAKETYEREQKLSRRLQEILDEVEDGLEEDGPRLEKALERLKEGGSNSADRDQAAADDDETDSDDGFDGDSGADRGASYRDEPALDGDEELAKAATHAEFVEQLQERLAKRKAGAVRHVQYRSEILVADDLNASTGDATDASRENETADVARDLPVEDAYLDDPDDPLTGDIEKGDDKELSNSADAAPYDFDFGDEDNAAGEEGSDRKRQTEEEMEAAEERKRKAIIAKETPWEGLRGLAFEQFRKHLADLFVVQTQIRVFLIEVNDLEMESDNAVAMALENRLDLMNQRGIVVDTFRQVEVAADALEAELGIRLEAELGTDPGRANPVRFDASANRYRAGFEFDSPLTRLEERNTYRAAQITHQRARRDFMELEDQISAQIRTDIRNLKFNRFRFEIARQQLIVAARQVDEAQVNLRTAIEPDSSFTRDLLNALQGLLDSKNNLIQSWVNYETSRMNLFRDLELMQIAPEGNWLNEYDDPSLQTPAGIPIAAAGPAVSSGSDAGRITADPTVDGGLPARFPSESTAEVLEPAAMGSTP